MKNTGVSPKHISNVAYALAFTTYIITYISNNSIQLPSPLDFSFGFLLQGENTINIPQIMLIMWSIHYLRRLYEVNFVHIYSRKMSWLEAVGAQIYYGGFAAWIALSIQQADYQTISLFTIAIAIFFVIAIVQGCEGLGLLYSVGVPM